MKRKIVQVSTHYNASHQRSVVVALADDGTAWWGAKTGEGFIGEDSVFKWNRIPELPEDTQNLTKVNS